MQALLEKKPTTIKGVYFKGGYLKSTMGPSWKLNIELLDPRNKFYSLNDV